MKKVATWCLAAGILAVAGTAAAWFHLYYKPRSDLRGCEENIRIIENAISMYANEHAGTVPGGRRTVTRAECAEWFRRGLVPRFLKSIPTCPAAGRDTYSQGYRQDNSTPEGDASLDAFTIRCRGRFHMAAGVPPDFPACTSSHGLLRPIRKSESRQALPERIEVDGISLADSRADLQGKFGVMRHTVEEWGLNDDETFLLECASLTHPTVLLDPSDRIKMVRGRSLTCTLGGARRDCRTMGDVSSAFGPPQWTVDLGNNIIQWIYDSNGVNMTVTGVDSPFCITLMRTSQ